VSLPVAILAGGLATRLRPITDSIPKALIEVAGRPFAAYQLDWLRDQDVREVRFLVGYRGEMIRDALGDGSQWNMHIDYVFDGKCLLGTGGALRRALPSLGPSFFVMHGDSYLQCELDAIRRTFEASGQPGLMTVFRNDNRWDRSNIEFANGRIVRYDKVRQAPNMTYIDYGLGILMARVLEPYPADQPFDLATVYRDLLAAGKLAAAEVSERFYEIGSAQGLAETRSFFEHRS
jgi:N-acetyl-alpha-D-muramate 1-phosphate uridylyltransferase